MKLKIAEVNGKQYAELSDGKPVYVHDDGKETAMDVPGLSERVTFLTSEADKAFRARDEAKAALRKFDGIEDAAKALEALNVVKNLDQKKLIDAGEVERVKQEVAKSFEGRITELEGEKGKLQDSLYGEMIGGRFSRSKFITEKMAIPADMVQASFGKQFKVEDGKVIAYNTNGDKIFSRSNPGELAGFDEALEIMVNSYPHKDFILKAPASGGGNAPGAKATGGKGAAVTRSHFDSMDPAARTQHMRSGGTVVDG